MLFGIAIRTLIGAILSAAGIASLAAFLLVVSQAPGAGSAGFLYGNIPSIGP